MLYILLIVLIGICAAKWIASKAALQTMIYYMETKKYPPPTTEELKACSLCVIKKMMGL